MHRFLVLAGLIVIVSGKLNVGNAYVIVDYAPSPLITLLLDAMKEEKIQLIFLSEEMDESIVRHQILNSRHLIVKSQTFLDNTNKDRDLPVILEITTKEKMIDDINWLKVQLPILRSQGYRFPSLTIANKR